MNFKDNKDRQLRILVSCLQVVNISSLIILV